MDTIKVIPHASASFLALVEFLRNKPLAGLVMPKCCWTLLLNLVWTAEHGLMGAWSLLGNQPDPKILQTWRKCFSKTIARGQFSSPFLGVKPFWCFICLEDCHEDGIKRLKRMCVKLLLPQSRGFTNSIVIFTSSLKCTVIDWKTLKH